MPCPSPPEAPVGYAGRGFVPSGASPVRPHSPSSPAAHADDRHRRQSAADLLPAAAVRRHPPGACEPGARCAAGRRERRARDRGRRRHPGRLRHAVAHADRRHRAPGLRLGRGRPPQGRGRHAGAARRLQREPAAHHRVLHPPGRRRAALCQVQGHRRQPGRGHAERAAPAGAVALAARLRAVRRRAAGRGQGALRADPGAAGRAEPGLLRACARRHRQLLLSGHERRAGRRARGRPGRHPRRGRGRRPGRPQAHAAHAGLPAGDAVRREPCASRAALHRLRHPRLRGGAARARQHPGDGRDPAPEAGGGRAAGLPELRRRLAGGQDGREPEAGHRLPARPRRPRPPLRREGPGRAARVRRQGAGPERAAVLGRLLRQREAQGGALRLQRPGGEAVLHRAEGARRAVPHHRDAVRGGDPPGQRAGLARVGALLPHRARRRADRPVLPRPLRAPGQAPRRLDGRREGPLAAPGHRRAADAGGASGVQLLGAGGRQTRAADA